MELREGGKYKRRDGVVSNRVLPCLNGKIELMIVWEDEKECIYFPNGRIYNPFNKSGGDNIMDVVEELKVLEQTEINTQENPLVVALQFYANEDNYFGKYNGKVQYYPAITEDGGEVAKNALETSSKTTTTEREAIKAWHEWKRLFEESQRTLSHQDGMEAQTAWDKLDDLMEALKQ